MGQVSLGGEEDVWENKHGSRIQSPPQSDPQDPKDKHKSQDQGQPPVMSTLLVPFSVGSVLQRAVKEAEDDYRNLIGGPRVWVLEKGGDTLVNILGKNDPWATGRPCTDER